MAIRDFKTTLSLGHQIEDLAEDYFTTNNWDYVDVRGTTEYQKIDVDYVLTRCDKQELWEVKLNYHDAKYKRPGEYVWIELSYENQRGWWDYAEPDYFFFYNADLQKGVIIKRDEAFIKYVNEQIADSNNVFDYPSDRRHNKIVKFKCLCLYIEDIPADIEMTKLIKRRKQCSQL